jgi:hypothetical protein
MKSLIFYILKRNWYKIKVKIKIKKIRGVGSDPIDPPSGYVLT